MLLVVQPEEEKIVMIKKGSPLLRCYCFTVDLLKACFLSNHLQWGGPHITACIDSCHLFSLLKVPRSGSIRFPHTDSLSLTHKHPSPSSQSLLMQRRSQSSSSLVVILFIHGIYTSVLRSSMPSGLKFINK